MFLYNSCQILSQTKKCFSLVVVYGKSMDLLHCSWFLSGFYPLEGLIFLANNDCHPALIYYIYDPQDCNIMILFNFLTIDIFAGRMDRRGEYEISGIDKKCHEGRSSSK